MQKLFLFTAAILLVAFNGFSQCTVNVSIPNDTITCGDCVQLTATGRGQGQSVFNESFNGGAPSGWAFTQQATFTNPCSPGGVDGTSHIWMGDNSGVPRTLQTLPYNFSTATAGVTICFDMLFAEQGGTSPCEGPDEPQEGVFLQYRIGNGPWITINYFDPNGGSDPQLINWTNWCFQLPAAALTGNVSIRWFQDSDSGAEYDHWGIDNVQIFFNDPSFVISVGSGGSNIYSFPTGNSGGVVPNNICPLITRTYSVSMSNNNGVTCRDSVRVVVRNPTIQINAGQDVSICQGECVNLAATGKVVKAPAKVPTYENLQPDTADLTSFGGLITEGAVVNINVRNLNMTTVQPNSILSVCIDQIRLQGFGISAASLQFYLLCPDSTVIRLMPINQATGNAGLFNYATLFNNICFVPTGPAVSTGTPPYTSSFGTEQPFNNLVGCTANGVWRLAVTPGGGLGGGTVITTGWSITFNDPEINYPPDVVWSPTANMTGSTTLTPNVCPTATQTYTVSASDTAGCVTVTDQVVVTVTPTCCDLEFTSSATQPTCGQSNGTINLNITQGSGAANYTFIWNDNNTNQNRTGLPAGTYSVTITDNGQANCSKDTIIILNNPSSLSLVLSNPVNPACGQNNGSITAAITGGTAPYVVTIDNGITQQTINVPIAISQTLNNLPAGNYIITIRDAQQCQTSATQSLVAPNSPTVSSITPSDETCPGNLDGSVTIQVSGGTSPFIYTWSNNATTQNLTNVAAGNYTVTVRDASNCTVSATTTVIAGNACCNIQITAVITQPSCGGSDGSINTTVVSQGTTSYLWSNAATTSDLSNLSPGTYGLTVTDAVCNKDTVFVINSSSNISLALSNPINPACGQNNGGITIAISNGTAPYTLQIDNGIFQQTLNIPSATQQQQNGLPSGNYTFTLTDSLGCQQIQTLTLVAPGSPTIDNIIATAETCAGASDGTVTIQVSGGNGAISYLWSNNATTQNLTGVAPGNYIVTVSDAAGCTVADNATVIAGPPCCNIVASSAATPTDCGVATGSITVTITSYDGTPYIFSATGNGQTFTANSTTSTATINNLFGGIYVLLLTDTNNCTYRDTIEVIENNNTIVLNLNSTDVACNGFNDGTATVDISGTNAPFTINWSNNSNDTLLTNLSPGTYVVTVTDQINCRRIDSLTINEPPVLSVSLGNDAFLCNGENIVLDAGSGFDDYIWSTSDSTQTITIDSAGTYFVTVANNSIGGLSCFANDTIVFGAADIAVNAGNDTSIIERDTAQLNAIVLGNSTQGIYSWTPIVDLSCTSCANPLATPFETTSYQVVYTDSNGCVASDSITITVIPGEYYFYMPNAFSPNGDGENEIVFPIMKGVDQFTWRIWNRWGQKVFECVNSIALCNWDGRVNGKLLDPSVFVWEAVVEFKKPSIERYKGSLTLVK